MNAYGPQCLQDLNYRMSEEQLDRLHPVLNDTLLGHERAEREFLSAYTGGRMHHAWLITGPKGVGKATLAYRIAKFLLSQSIKDDGPSLFGDALETLEPDSLDSVPDSDTIQRIKSMAHGGLLTVARSEDPKKKTLRKMIVIDDVRKAHSFFNRTSAEGGWRVVIVDAADEMNRNSANALLKILEEPPKHSILLLVAHAPGKLLPTIRSRCRQLKLTPMADDSVRAVLAMKYPEMDVAQLEKLSILAEGSPGKAIRLAEENGLPLYDRMIDILHTMPRVNTPQVHKLAGDLGAVKADASYRLFMEYLSGWLERLVRFSASGDTPYFVHAREEALFQRLAATCRVDRWIEVWEKMHKLEIRAETLNMDRKQLLVSLLFSISQAAQG